MSEDHISPLGIERLTEIANSERIIFEQQITAAKMHLMELKHKGKLVGCTSYVQRKLQIGYNRAAHIMETLEARKFITEPDNTGERHGVDQ